MEGAKILYTYTLSPAGGARICAYRTRRLSAESYLCMTGPCAWRRGGGGEVHPLPEATRFVQALVQAEPLQLLCVLLCQRGGGVGLRHVQFADSPAAAALSAQQSARRVSRGQLEIRWQPGNAHERDGPADSEAKFATRTQNPCPSHLECALG